ncbi:class F sortase [Cytobacillus oceanisediminis]|uniref:class F sortase n=1 Tax=Cytobacillus oceanisediminis TaxID=665099 RepID=UPI00203F9C02|nr:class F sortase [Cytobacillus oceanisediminis]MCM3406023.1 class F sortase [Cytobacillus oceanisediminis]
MKQHLTAILLGTTIIISGCTENNESELTAQTEKEGKDLSDQTEQPAVSISPYQQVEAAEIIKDDRTGVIPSVIEIPAIGVEASVEEVGLLDDGEMDVPAGFETTGWYEGGYKPGEPGNAVIAGHVDSKKGPAVFFNLKKLKTGDEVIVTGGNMARKVFEVIEVKAYPRLDAPLKMIFGYTSRSALNLITCTGTYDHDSTQHSERLVVYTQLKQ